MGLGTSVKSILSSPMEHFDIQFQTVCQTGYMNVKQILWLAVLFCLTWAYTKLRADLTKKSMYIYIAQYVWENDRS